MRSNKQWLEHEKFLVDGKKKKIRIEGDGTLEEQETELETSWGPF